MPWVWGEAGAIGLNVGTFLVWFSAEPSSSTRQSQLSQDRYTSAAPAHEMVPTGRLTENPNIAMLAFVSGILLDVHFVPQLWIINTNALTQMDIWQCLSLSRACQAGAEWTVWIFELGRCLSENGDGQMKYLGVSKESAIHMCQLSTFDSGKVPRKDVCMPKTNAVVQHLPRVGFHNDGSPPQRGTVVAKSAPWRTTPTWVEFIGCENRWRSSLWVEGTDQSAMVDCNTQAHIG